MLNPNILTGATMVAAPPKPVLTPEISPTTILFPTALPASKAAGVAAIRVSRFINDLNLEQLDAQGRTIIGFVFHPIVDSGTKKITAIAVTQMGSSATPSTLTPAQISALSVITNELKQFKASGSAGPTGLGLPGAAKSRQRKSTLGSWLGTIATAIDCGAAAIEGGANLLADAACVASYGAWVDENGGDDGDVVDTTPPWTVLEGFGDPFPEEVGTSFQTTSQDGVDDPIGTPVGYGGSVGGATGSDDGSGGGSGDGIDDKPGLQPD